MLIRASESWPPALAAAVAMLALASHDLLGAVAAKEAVVRRSAAFAVGGAPVFVVLFWVYAGSLQYADLAAQAYLLLGAAPPADEIRALGSQAAHTDARRSRDLHPQWLLPRSRRAGATSSGARGGS